MAALNEAAEAFEEGTNSIFRQWTALELAVHNQWGGPESEEKASFLIKEVLELFGGKKQIYKDDVSMLIEDFVESHFNMICEDGSPEEIGEIIVAMYRQCAEGDYSLVSATIERERTRQNVVANSSGLEAGGDVIEETEDDRKASDNVDTIVAEEVQQVITSEIDEDGFQTVSRGKRTRSNKRYG